MSHSILTRRHRWLLGVAALAALSVGLVGWSRARAQDTFRQSYTNPADGKAIQLNADDISTWAEGTRRVFVLKGRVWLEHGALNVRMPQAVVWIDEQSKKTKGYYEVAFYGEEATINEGGRERSAATAELQFATRGVIRVKSYLSRTQEKILRDDPLFVRAKDRMAAALASSSAPRNPLEAAAEESEPKVFPAPPVVPVQKVTPPAPPPLPAPETPKGPFPPAQDQALPPPVVPPPAQTPSAGLVPPLFGGASEGTPKRLIIRPRSSLDLQAGTPYPQANGETAVVVTSGVILTVVDPSNNKVLVDIEADRLVFWAKGNPGEMFNNLRSSQGQTSKSLEFYLSGNVEIRNQQKKETETLRADEVYYDVGRNVAIALRADLEIKEPRLPYPIHFKAQEIQQLNPKLFQAKQSEVYATILPSDPGLKIQVREATLEEEDIIRKTIFGTQFVDEKTGEPLAYKQRTFTGRGNVLRLENVPIMYFPYLRGDVQDPLGPLDNVSFNYNRIFGFQLFTTWDLYELIGVKPLPGRQWRLFADGMTERGPALGTEFRIDGREILGIPGKYETYLKAYGIYDTGVDILGGDRGQVAYVTPTTTVPIVHPDFRGWFLGRFNGQEMPLGFSVQAQASVQSDRNFLQQYFQPQWDSNINQETFLYVKQQDSIWAWSALTEPYIRRWITETEWLPKVDGYVLGLSLFDLFTYNVHGSMGYAQLHPTEEPSFAYLNTDQRVNTGRFDLWNEISLPMNAGPFKVVPYLVGDAAYYTEALNGDDRGRLYGGGGVRGSMPLSRLYPEAHSELFNVNGIFHKVVFSANYFNAFSDTSLNLLPQLDRLNDDASDQALRDMRPRLPTFYPQDAVFLANSPLFNPQRYALRRLVDNRADTLDSIEVVQLGVRQRWQTKRGFPGREHIIDWMTLDLRASIFPRADRDNFGQNLGILEYDWVWNIGDRTALVSDGWFEPTIDNGPTVFNFGAVLNRTDRTSFYLGYRHIDPLEVRAVIGSLNYALSAKYALTFSASYDFGNDIQSNAVTITRMGTDLQVSVGLSYNSILNTVGVQFAIVPTLVPMARQGGPLANPALASGSGGASGARR